MKTYNLKITLLLSMSIMALNLLAQRADIQYFRYNDRAGLNVFETSKDDTVAYDGFKIRVGGDFAMQFQGLSQSNDLVGDTLVELANNFSLPTANLNLDIQLHDGVRMHLRTYLSSRHHAEAWVKGGYLQMDKLDFISKGFLSGFMNVATIRIGMDEINYGDAHFRRSDNARTIFNPFVGNYIMDSFTTEPFGELTIQSNGLIGLIGLSNGRLNQSPIAGDDGMAFYAKLGFDKELRDDLRVRLTGSLYSSTDQGTRDYIYGGDRAGARYYSVMEGLNDARVSDFLPRLNPGFAYQTAFQINPFIQVSGFEFFGIFEISNNGDDDTGGSFTQLGAEALYRFGGVDQFYLGGRFNSVTGEFADGQESSDVSRFHLGGGWFMTDNVLTKFEYVNNTYDGEGWDGTKFQGASFDGIMIEANISF